jgi:hypothetical protein
MLISEFKLVSEILLGSFSTNLIQLGPCMLQSGIIATGSTLDPYGPRTNANLDKFVVTDFGLSNLGKNSGNS